MFYDRFNEHRDLSYLVLLQFVAIGFGWGFVALGVRVWTAAGRDIRPSALFVRDWGAALFLIPALWLALALIARRSGPGCGERHFAFWSGLAVAIGIFLYLLFLGALARTTSLIQVMSS